MYGYIVYIEYRYIGRKLAHFMKKILFGILACALLLGPIVFGVERAYAQSQVTIDGAGATFPFPLIDTWRVEYKKIQPNVNINYQSIGSGGGIKQFT